MRRAVWAKRVRRCLLLRAVAVCRGRRAGEATREAFDSWRACCRSGVAEKRAAEKVAGVVKKVSSTV